jgi:hypothetical protein
MFIMKDRHFEAFKRIAQQGFEDRLVIHVRDRFPAECDALGEDGVRDRIRDGIDRAARYDIVAERDVCRFIRFMFGIRPDFDTSGKTRWAGEILNDLESPASDRLDRIRKEASQQRVRRQDVA